MNPLKLKNSFLILKMNLLLRFFTAFFLFSLAVFQTNAQDQDLVEVSGRVVMEQTTQPIPHAVISVVGSDRGVTSNGNGMFSIVLKKGEKCKVEMGGFKSSSFTLPANYDKKYYTVNIPLGIDTIYLDNVTIHQMTPSEFDFAFKYLYSPDENVLASRNNMSEEAQYLMMAFMQRDANENQTLQQMQNYMRYGSNYGQPSSTNLGNPYAWRDFINAWKRGDFKGKKN